MIKKRSSGAFPPRTGGAMQAFGRTVVVSVQLSILPVLGEAKDDLDFNKIGRNGYGLWDCAAIGQLANEDEELVQELIEKGYDQLSILIDAWRDGLLTEQNTSELPIAFRWYLVSGPSSDFTLGYMWAQFTDHAHDETWPNLADTSYDSQREIQTIRAETQFRVRNCVLLLE